MIGDAKLKAEAKEIKVKADVHKDINGIPQHPKFMKQSNQYKEEEIITLEDESDTNSNNAFCHSSYNRRNILKKPKKVSCLKECHKVAEDKLDKSLRAAVSDKKFGVSDSKRTSLVYLGRPSYDADEATVRSHMIANSITNDDK